MTQNFYLSEEIAMAQTVQLTNGSAVELDHFQWSGLASHECDSLTVTGRLVTPRLAAMKHSDGRVVVYATVKDGSKLSSAGGEVLASADAPAIEKALGRLSAQFSRGKYLLAQCMAQIDSKVAT
jgi:hypothetical protein